MLKPESQAHLLRAQDALKTARLACDAGLVHDSLSRSYYAAFHACQALLASIGEHPKTHKGLVLQTRRHFGKKLGEGAIVFLTRLQSLREDSDYEVGFKPKPSEAELALQRAEQFVANATKLLL